MSTDRGQQLSGRYARRLFPRALFFISVVAMLTACGGGGSDGAPLAGAFVVGQGTNLTSVTVRAGSDVVLNGENSDGTQFPLQSAVWRQIDSSGVVVQLDKRTELTRAFKVPSVDVATKLTFELTVTNSDGQKSTKTVDVSIVPVGDGDRFLSFFRSLDGKYTVVAALATGVTTTANVTFTVTQQQLVNYADRASQSDVANQFNVRIGTPKSESSSFLSGTRADWTTIDEAVGAYYHPNLSFAVPALDLDDINILFDEFDPDRGIADHQRDSVEQSVDLTLQVTAGTCEVSTTHAPIDCQQAAILYVLKSDGTLVDNLGGTSATHRVVSVDVLKALNPSTAANTAPESALTAETYYAAVDPQNRRTTLSDWLANSGFTNSAGAFIDPSQFARALYVNNYDLGFTRDMFVRQDATTGNIFAYVTNFPALRPAILRSTDPAHQDDDVLATVAMEFSPPDQDPAADKFVKFFVFVPDGDGEQPRVGSLDFDGRGEKWVPGACLPCHGGTARSLQQPAGVLIYPDNGNIEAAFLPWDLDSFLYVAAADKKLVDPLVTEGFKINQGYLTQAQLDRFSRENQEAAFRKMNEAVLATMDPNQPSGRFDVVRDQIHGWYGEEDDTGNTLPNVNFSAALPTAIQNGWRATEPANQGVVGLESFYNDVFSRHCRVCHSQAKEINQFASFTNFKAAATQGLIQQFVFQDGVMPNARLDMDRLWVDFHGAAVPPAQRIIDILGIDPDLASGPGRPVARIDGAAVQTVAPVSAMANVAPLVETLDAKNLDTIRLDATGSSFVEDFKWEFTSQPTGSTAVLVGADTALPAFKADKAGIYEITFTGSNTLSTGAVLTSTALVTVDATALAPKLANGLVALSVLESTPDQVVTAVISESNLKWLDEDTVPESLVFTVTRATARGALKNNGVVVGVGDTFTQRDISDGLLTYTEGQAGAASSLTDGFQYTITDDAANSITAQEFVINVTLRNDRPVLVTAQGTALQVVENGTGHIGTNIVEWRDEDNLASEILYTIVSPPAQGTLTNNSLPLVVGSTFTQADVDATDPNGIDPDVGLVYDHDDASQASSDSFTYNVTDGASTPQAGTLLIAVQNVDDTPALATGRSFNVSAGLEVGIAGGLSDTGFPIGAIAVLDADTTDANDITLTLTSVPATGRIELRTGLPQTVGVNGTFTLQEVLDGRAFYVHDGVDLFNDATDSFSLKVQDLSGPNVDLPVVVTVFVDKRTDGPVAGGDLQAALLSYIDDLKARDGALRSSAPPPDWESVVLTTSDLNFTDGGPSPGAECAIKYRLVLAPNFGKLMRGLTEIVTSTSFVGATANQVFTQGEVGGGQIRYENRNIGDGNVANNGDADGDTAADLADTFSFVASDCVLVSPTTAFSISRSINPDLDLGWVIDSIWTDASSGFNCGTTNGSADTSDRGCRNCHAAANNCGVGTGPSWTTTPATGGLLQFCALKTRYPALLPDYATTSGHGGGVVIQPNSVPHDVLRQWSAEGFPLPSGTTCP